MCSGMTISSARVPYGRGAVIPYAGDKGDGLCAFSAG